MKKNLYYIDEEEKRRILNLHESRTKKQYLVSEQSTDEPETEMGRMMKYGYSPQSEMGKLMKYGYNNWSKYPCVFNHPDAIDYESKTEEKPNDETRWVQIGNMVYSYEGKKFNVADNNIQTVYDCNDYEFTNKNPIGWDNYPCVTNKNVEKQQDYTEYYEFTLDDKTIIKVQSDGKYRDGNNNTKEFMCDNDNIVDKETNKILVKSIETNQATTSSDNVADNTKKTSTTNTGGQGYTTNKFGYVMNNVLKPEVLADIRSKIGSTEQTESPGKLSQTDINLLYKKISGQ